MEGQLCSGGVHARCNEVITMHQKTREQHGVRLLRYLHFRIQHVRDKSMRGLCSAGIRHNDVNSGQPIPAVQSLPACHEFID